MPPAPPILVIKLGALGDLVQAMGPCAAIRRHHAGSPVTLLTTAPYADFARASGYFDDVWVDKRPRGLELGKWLGLRARLRRGKFARVYDLQTSDRSSFYLRLFWPGPFPEWSGIARGCSHPHANPRRDSMHTIERQAEQLLMAGIDHVTPPDLSWATADLARFDLPEHYALLAPGGAPHRPDKRWPPESFAALAKWLVRQGITPLLIGTEAEADVIGSVAGACPQARNLMGRTGLLDIAALARGARAAVGNDTGPMHLMAAAGAPSVALFSAASDPALCGQRGPHVAILRRPVLADLEPGDVVKALGALWQEGSTS